MNAWIRLCMTGALVALVTCKQPHILYIVMDDQGYGDMGYTVSNNDVRTPLLDQLARDGLILERHYTAWMCTPTRASIMTGRYPITLGIQHNVFQPHTEECLNEHEVLLPSVVKANGYATHLIGKWHLGYARWSCMPCMRGFDTSYGYISGEIGYMDHEQQSYYDFYQCSYSEKEGLQFKSLKEDKGIYTNYLFNRRAKQIIESHNAEQPLFIYLAMQSVHSPYFAPTKYFTCFDNARCTMQAMLNSAEELIGDVISYMKKAELWNDTLLIYHSDNGGPSSDYNSNGGLRGSKSHLWEGGVRTAAFMYSANHDIMPNRGSTACYVHSTDWYSSIVAVSGGWSTYKNVTGLDMPADLDSIDQSSHLLFGNSTCPRTQIMLHIDPVMRVAGYLKNQYKLLIGDQDDMVSCQEAIYYPLNISSINLDIIQLFDIVSDPNETTDISDEYPDIVEDLKLDVIKYLSHQNPLQCQMPTVDGAYPNDEVPYYVPFDFSDHEPDVTFVI